jgi:tetratricopeptide (TPR) repeat protein
MYTVREVATVLGVKPSRLRGYLRAGLVSPQRGARGELRFSFQDLVLLRKAEGLVGSRIAPHRVHAALLRTRAHLGDDVPLSGVQFEADGQSIVASDGQQRWEPTSGQVVFDFQPTAAVLGSERTAGQLGQLHELRQPKPPLAPDPSAGDAPPLTAEQHYERGYTLEEGGNDAGAMEEYRRALAQDPAHADAHVNLGRLLHEAGKPFDALEHYRAALNTRPGDGTAAFNLGVALEDLERVAEAITAYERSIGIDPANADAHYNVARLFEQSGNSESAIRHLLIYRQLTRKRR